MTITQNGFTPPAGGYIRHRDRMIQESVFEDVVDTLITCRWLAGTTSHEVHDPYNGNLVGLPTTTELQTLALLEGKPINLIDYFPEAEGRTAIGSVGENGISRTPLNTLAIDGGMRGDSTPLELGSTSELVPHTFTMAFYAISDATALAVLNDLADRYLGRLVRGDAIALWDYNNLGSQPAAYLDVEAFTYRVNTEAVTLPEVHLYFAELRLTDEVD